ncbi:major facilitator superfamily domain-containing protein [Lasiosphaeris hirsuta]|uniref:Major facilitator superfamily domain-containing protein n=1 Tax=Lasiosphaeris hirsuta TaxID=260670 RepID=A0AA40E285_9PEZI|nr:major facilitator superfamily domain-containing protein [Lasiosphaeris hirsuta]
MGDKAFRPVPVAPWTPSRSAAMRRPRPDTPRPATWAGIMVPAGPGTPTPRTPAPQTPTSQTSAQRTPEPAPQENEPMLSPNPQIWDMNLDSHPLPPLPPTEMEIRHTWSFWPILVSLSLAGMLVGFEGTILTNALPTIMEEMGGDAWYFWVVNAFFLVSATTAPLYGQFSRLSGRRWVMITAVALFTLGSGICGGANNMAMLIAGRAIQGLGAGGINLLIEDIIDDLVPADEFSDHLFAVMTPTIAASASGSLFGGAIVTFASWRWVFYIHVPIGSVALILQLLYLRTEYRIDQPLTVVEKLRLVDVSGLFCFLVSNYAILLGMGSNFGLFTLVITFITGFIWLIAFFTYEFGLYPRFRPVEPLLFKDAFSNRTSAAAIFLTFTLSICTQLVMYFLPIYAQAITGSTPYESGLETLPFFVCLVPFALLGVLVERQTHQFNFQLTGALGLGLGLNTLLPAVLVSLPAGPDTAGADVKARDTWRFARAFGKLYAFAMPSTVFNKRCAHFADGLSDATVAERLRDGRAYQAATAAFSNAIGGDPAVRDQVVHVFQQALQAVWYVGVGFAAMGFLAVFFEKNLRTPSAGEHRGQRSSEEDGIEMVAMPRGRRVRTPPESRVSEA